MHTKLTVRNLLPIMYQSCDAITTQYLYSAQLQRQLLEDVVSYIYNGLVKLYNANT